MTLLAEVMWWVFFIGACMTTAGLVNIVLRSIIMRKDPEYVKAMNLVFGIIMLIGILFMIIAFPFKG